MNTQLGPVVVTPIADGFRVAVSGVVHTDTTVLDGELTRVMELGPRVVELDLVGVSYLSTCGIAALMAFRKGIVGHGGTVRVIAIQKTVLGILQATSLVALLGAGEAKVG